MKTEEAKRIAMGLRTDFKCESDTMVDFCNTIIKALEQEPCEDAISRQAVLEIFGYVMDYWKEHAIDVEPHEIKDALIEQYEFTAKQLKELPPVTPQQKMGRWILTMPRGAEEWCYKCSKCGFWKYKKTIDLSKFNYCPNCGQSKMQEVEE